MISDWHSILSENRHPYAGGKSNAVFFEDPARIKVELIASDSENPENLS